MNEKRTPASKKALQLKKYFQNERVDYEYLKKVFQYLRSVLEVNVTTQSKKLPYVPNQEELKKFYQVVWNNKDKTQLKHVLLIKVLMYTGMRVGELIKVKLVDVHLDNCQVTIKEGKGGKDRMVPFPAEFKESLGMHLSNYKNEDRVWLFESAWRKPYSDRGVRRIMERTSQEAGLQQNISPHKLRHFLFTWLKKQGIDDALIQPYSGHESRKSLEIYSKLSIASAQKSYEEVIKKFPI